MRVIFAHGFMGSALAIGLWFAASTPAVAGSADDAILAELNFARSHPQEYAEALAREPVSAWERSLAADPAAEADAAAYVQAIDFLRRQQPLPPLSADDHLVAAAREHVAAQGPAGRIGHESADGERFDARLRRHGVSAQIAAEDIAYGPHNPRDVVRELIIDRGVPDRGHRRNIFLASIQSAGVVCGPHRDYSAMCVIDFSSAPPPQPIEQLAPPATSLAPVRLVSLDLPTLAAPAIDLVRTAEADEGRFHRLLRRFFA